MSAGLNGVLRGFGLFFIVVVLAGCRHQAPPANPASLYVRLGGEPGITAVVGDFVDRAAADPRVNFTRKGHPTQWDATPETIAKLKVRLTQFVEEAVGGKQHYEGRPMVLVHTGMEISDEEFGAAADDLKASLDKFKVAAREQDEMLRIVAGTRDAIVGK